MRSSNTHRCLPTLKSDLKMTPNHTQTHTRQPNESGILMRETKGKQERSETRMINCGPQHEKVML